MPNQESFADCVARYEAQGATIEMGRDRVGTAGHPDMAVEVVHRGKGKAEILQVGGAWKAATITMDPIFLRLIRHGNKKLEAILWIALEDEPGDGATEGNIERYLTTTLVADLWYRGSTARAAQEIAWIRRHPEAFGETTCQQGPTR